jgi:hypothetical protein
MVTTVMLGGAEQALWTRAAVKHASVLAQVSASACYVLYIVLCSKVCVLFVWWVVQSKRCGQERQ